MSQDGVTSLIHIRPTKPEKHQKCIGVSGIELVACARSPKHPCWLANPDLARRICSRLM